jgi:hypothetical protein
MKRSDRAHQVNRPAQVSDAHVEQDTQAKDNQRNITGKINIQGTVETTVPTNLLEEFKASETAKNFRETIRLWLEFLTFISALIILFFTGCQMKTGRDNLALLRSQFARDERPYVVVWDSPHFVDIATQNQIDEPVAGRPLAVNIRYKNIGKSPALNVRATRFIYVGDPAFAEFAAPRTIPPTSNQTVFPEDPRLMTAIYRTDQKTNTGSSYDSANLIRWEGETPIAIFGNIYYEDAFGNKYCTEYADRYLGVLWADQSGANKSSCEDVLAKKE